MKPRITATALVLAVTAAAAPRASAQVAASSTVRCGESASGVSSLLASTATAVIGVGPAGPIWHADAAGRVEALAADRQCAQDDLHDAARDLLPSQPREARGATTADAIGPWGAAPRQGVFVRARTHGRVDVTGGSALSYDLGIGAWRSFDGVSVSTYVQDVETHFSRAGRGAAQRTVSLGCDTECVLGSGPSGSGSTAKASALANWHARELVVAATGSLRNISLSASAGSGISTLEGRRRWVMGEVAAPLAGRMDMVLLARSASRFVGVDGSHVGVMLRYHIGRVSASNSPSPTALAPFRAVRAQREHRYRLLFQPGHASSVRLRADFTAWEAVSLELGTGDEWVVELDVDAGMHQVLVSIDGGPWQAPVGLPTAPDGFGQTVGVLQIGAE